MRFRSRLQRMKGIYPRAIPPDGAEATGMVTEAGDTIYSEQVPVVVKEPVRDENGKPIWRRNQVTGEPLVKLHKRFQATDDNGEKVFETRYFWLYSGRNGNVRKMPWNPEQAKADATRKARIQKREAILEKLAEKAADADMDLDTAVERILGLARDEQAEDAARIADEGDVF